MAKNKFILEPSNRGISDEEILDDIKEVAQKLGKDSLTYKEYRSGGGKLDVSVIYRRVGPWNNALAKAGLTPAREVNISDER